MTYYKVLGANREANMGRGRWPQVKRWTDEVPNPRLCERGWHLVPADHLVGFLSYGPAIWTAEPHPDAELIEGSDKVVCSRARLVERTLWDETRARLFAVDCAERVLPIFEKERPGDDRPRKAIEVAGLHALGLATDKERAAAWAAAGDAARAAARDAARAAARDAARAAAGAAARAAAWAAARDAAGDAAGAAAGAAERKWQTGRLLAYLHEPDLVRVLSEGQEAGT